MASSAYESSVLCLDNVTYILSVPSGSWVGAEVILHQWLTSCLFIAGFVNFHPPLWGIPSFYQFRKMTLKQSDDTEACLGKKSDPATEPKFQFFPLEMPGENVSWHLKVSSITWVGNSGLYVCFSNDFRVLSLCYFSLLSKTWSCS